MPTWTPVDDCGQSERFRVRQGLGQGFVSSPLILDIFNAVLVDVILQHFVADTVTFLDSGYLNNAPQSGDGDCVEERMPERAQRLGWGTLHADDADTT